MNSDDTTLRRAEVLSGPHIRLAAQLLALARLVPADLGVLSMSADKHLGIRFHLHGDKAELVQRCAAFADELGLPAGINTLTPERECIVEHHKWCGLSEGVPVEVVILADVPPLGPLGPDVSGGAR